MDNAFRYCFDKYKACPNYLELLVERRVKRATGAVLQNVDGKDRFTQERFVRSEPIVQLTVHSRDISHGYAEHASSV